MHTVHESLEQLDARVVQDALAFIDAFYASSDEANASDADDECVSETDESRSSVHSLRDALEENLCGKVAATDQFTADDHADSHTQLAASYNEIQKRLDACGWLRHQLQLRPWTRTLSPLTDLDVAVLLQRRLDEIIARVTSRDRPFRVRARSVEEVSDQYFDASQSGIAMRFRSARFIPFKMSVLAKAMWGVLLDGSLSGPGRSQVAMMEQKDTLLFQFRDDPDGTEGAVAMRRVYLPDGTILLCWTAVSAAPHAMRDHPTNIFGDLEIHEVGWIRIGRCCGSSRDSPRVFMESVSDVAARPTCTACAHNQALTRRRLDCFKTTLIVLTEENFIKNRQVLENRMLDASVQATGRHQSHMDRQA